jgi:hypothetical protein
MARRFLYRALVPAAALALTGAIGLTPASASSLTWQLTSVVGDPAGQTAFTSVTASSADNAWVAGNSCTDVSCPAAIVEQWNGQSWQPVTVPSNIGDAFMPLVVATSSASNTWIFGSDVNDIGYGVQITSSGMTETQLPADGGLTFNGAAVFSPDDVWAFGVTGDFVNDVFSAYAAHYDGQAWTQLATPPVIPDSVSALSSDNLWILGQTSFTSVNSPIVYEAARWTGSGWLTVPLPDAANLNLPAGTTFTPISILADNSHDVWVTAGLDTTCPPCGFGTGVVVLHWNGNSWHSVDVPAGISSFGTAVASDGQGGLWVPGYSTSGEPYQYHFLNNNWASQLLPTQDGDQVSEYDLAWVPGTTSLWGAAGLFNSTTGASQGAIYQYGP